MNRFSAVGVVCLFAAACAAQGGQSMFRGGPSHLGVYDSQAPQQLSLKWTFSTNGSIYSSPAVANGVVYFGSADGNLYAVDAATGKLRWKFDAHGRVNSSPAVVDGAVYVVSLDGNLYAVDAATGKQRWAFATEGEHRSTKAGNLGAFPHTEVVPDAWDFYLSSPAVAGGAVYFGSGDGHVYAIDAAAGTLKWKYKTGDDAKTHVMTGIPGSASVANGSVYFGSRDANFYALNAQTGALKWTVPNDGSWVIASPAFADGVVYYTTSDSHRFQALDADSGKILYWLPTNIFAFSSPAIAGSHAYFGTFDGLLHVVDLKKRAYAGAFAAPGFSANGPRFLGPDGKLKDEIWSGPTLDDSIVDIHTKLFSMGSILSSPAVQDGVVYFGSVDGKLYALGN
jgi:outer membrane protein assembly factor BamB